MKPGMQRDILVAFWFLFDEFDIGDDSAPAEGPALPASTRQPPVSASPPVQRPKSDRPA